MSKKKATKKLTKKPGRAKGLVDTPRKDGLIDVDTFLRGLETQYESGVALTVKDAVTLAEALRERLPDFVGEDDIRYETEDPAQTSEEVSSLCHAIAAIYEAETTPKGGES
jgi:hypothetical protein